MVAKSFDTTTKSIPYSDQVINSVKNGGLASSIQ